MYPNSGFQYRSTTYWSSTSIVGKVPLPSSSPIQTPNNPQVLAPTCLEIAGWIGPARPAPDLSRIQIARIRQRLPKQHLALSDIESMTIRSDPLGPPSTTYPVAEYKLPLPDDEYVVDTVRIEKLALRPISSSSFATGEVERGEKRHDNEKPLTYDAAVQFAIAGRSWPLRLSYDVSYITAYPCAHGPHPLFFDYVYERVKVDEILTIKDWGGLNGNGGMGSIGAASSKSNVGKDKGEEEREDDDDEREKVLVIEAFGVSDNEVLARAWCSHWYVHFTSFSIPSPFPHNYHKYTMY
jgi:hypothetical protein